MDIHGWVEVKKDGKWIAVNEIEDQSRNYRRFAALAGVCGDGPAPRGLPDDLGDTTRYAIEHWGEDGHSHSYMSVEDAANIWRDTDFVSPGKYWLKFPEVKYLGHDNEYHEGLEARVVFWFDN